MAWKLPNSNSDPSQNGGNVNQPASLLSNCLLEEAYGTKSFRPRANAAAIACVRPISVIVNVVWTNGTTGVGAVHA